MKPAPFDLVECATLADAVDALAAGGDGAKPAAGTQSLGPMLNLRLARPDLLVDLSRVPDLRGAREEADAVIYGAAVTHAEIEDGVVPDATPGWLAMVARGIAYRAVRNRGTLGGSLAHADPAADWVNALTALGAELEVRSGGDIRLVPLDGFFTGAFATSLAPGEIIAGVRVPRRGPGAVWAYRKYCRKVGEFAKAIAAILVDPDRGDTRVLVGAIERPPILLPDADGLVAGRADPEAAIAQALPDLAPSALRLHAGVLRAALNDATRMRSRSDA